MTSPPKSLAEKRDEEGLRELSRAQVVTTGLDMFQHMYRKGFDACFAIMSEREKILREAGNYLDSSVTGLLENDEIECRADEDCDHCYAKQASNEWHEALDKLAKQDGGDK